MMKKIVLVFLAINLVSCQKKQEKYSEPPPSMESMTLNNKIISKYINIPNTKIFLLPFDKNYRLNNGSMISKDNSYSITVMDTEGDAAKSTLSDFSKEKFEAFGIKVFDDKSITINGAKSKILFFQTDSTAKGAILFIDNKIEKILITATYNANDTLLENKVKEILHSIVYDKDAKIDYLKNITFKLDLNKTKFKFQKFYANFYSFTEEGKDSGIQAPSILVSEKPCIGNPDLKSVLNELKDLAGAMFGLEDIEVKNIVETENSLQFEFYGKTDKKPTLFFYKVLKNPNKDFILYLMASSKQNIDQDLVQFKEIANTFSFK